MSPAVSILLVIMTMGFGTSCVHAREAASACNAIEDHGFATDTNNMSSCNSGIDVQYAAQVTMASLSASLVEEDINTSIHTCLFAVAFFILGLLIYLELEKVQPTTKNLGADVARPLPLLVKGIDIILDRLPFVIWDVMDPAVLLNKGARDAGLPANYPPSVVEAIETLCRSLKDDNVQLHWIGRW